MKGSPLLRALIAFAFIALAGIPLWKLTAVDAAVAAPAQAEAGVLPIGLRLTFSAAPESFAISHLGKVVWADKSHESHTTYESHDLALPFPKEGVDFVVKVAWPGDAEGALRLRLTDPDGNEHDKTVWGRGEMEEVITFP